MKTNKNSVCPVVSAAKTYSHRASAAAQPVVCLSSYDGEREGVTDKTDFDIILVTLHFS